MTTKPAREFWKEAMQIDQMGDDEQYWELFPFPGARSIYYEETPPGWVCARVTFPGSSSYTMEFYVTPEGKLVDSEESG